ncbi:hypothetical protein [Novosphingobium lentum]|uniref:hypothetical protein n=1 Tax=Novosphingobium lentum TaxID=145287 RepID=UPI00082EDE17|nr:hypothetical protein [Novosphingobium lentum]
MNLFGKAALTAAFAASALTAAAPAEARDYYRHRGGGDDAAIAIGAGVVGLALGAALASDHRDYDDGYYYDRGYYPRYRGSYYYYNSYPAYRGNYYRDRDWRRDRRGWDHDGDRRGWGGRGEGRGHHRGW